MSHLNEEAQEFLLKVRQDVALMENDTCVSVANRVVKLLTGKKEPPPAAEQEVQSSVARSKFECFQACLPWNLFGPTYIRGSDSFITALNAVDDAVFKLTLFYVNRLNWSHHLAVAKIDGDVMIFQGWVTKFSLEEWLDGSRRCAGKAAMRYSPGNRDYRPEYAAEWLRMLVELETAAIDRDRDTFDARALSLFSVDTSTEPLFDYTFAHQSFFVAWQRHALPGRRPRGGPVETKSLKKKDDYLEMV
ncbi:hypothetical protein JYJ95_26285 [Corallococcus exiguus]|uniref:hypothetical protein n=1 Tax=Corallococcus exiguus TaxID=83462 RepID=UPI001A8C77C4|nr:hypothetical protein [Corallococcus exiguus]MBN8470035.1 hypothetical protein [Corallococcus exiguus]